MLMIMAIDFHQPICRESKTTNPNRIQVAHFCQCCGCVFNYREFIKKALLPADLMVYCIATLAGMIRLRLYFDKGLLYWVVLPREHQG